MMLLVLPAYVLGRDGISGLRIYIIHVAAAAAAAAGGGAFERVVSD